MTTVLVVDDEAIVRDVVTRYLERDGIHAVVADNGDDARTMMAGSEHELHALGPP